jgi:hypothetical protein
MMLIGVTKLPIFLVTHTIGDLSVDFRWKRVHLFDQLSCQLLYEKCMEQPVAKVENVQSKPKRKWRPLPLDTVVSKEHTTLQSYWHEICKIDLL